MKIWVPRSLKKGDVIAVISPAGLVEKERILLASKLLESWGLQINWGKYVFGSNHIFSGSDAERLSDLQNALDDPEISAIICARGGYGLSRIIHQVNLSKFLKHPKWLIGFSDITLLHALINKAGVQSLHAPVLNSLHMFAADDFSPEYLRKALFGETFSYKIDAQPQNRIGIANGELIGGNLSMLNNLRGTPWDISPEGKILFIEDVGEYLYHLDRMMMNLKNGGILEKISGLICGGFTEMKDQTIPFGKTAEEIISEAVNDYNYPVAFGFPAGHMQPNYSLKMGANVLLAVNEKEILLSF